MTLILALECCDALVLASDSQATLDTSGQGVKSVVDKIHCPWNDLAWGASGPTSLIQVAAQALRDSYQGAEAFSQRSRKQVREGFATTVSRVVRQRLTDQFIDVGKPPGVSFLAVARCKEGPTILEVAPNMLEHDHDQTGYAAIGSGDIFPYVALAGLRHFDVRKRSLYEAKLIAYRTMEDAISVAASGIGPPIQMIELPFASLPARKLLDDDLRALRDKVQEWKALESDVLSRFVGLSSPPDNAAEQVGAKDLPPPGRP